MLLHGIEKKAFLENAGVLAHPAHLDNKVSESASTASWPIGPFR